MLRSCEEGSGHPAAGARGVILQHLSPKSNTCRGQWLTSHWQSLGPIKLECTSENPARLFTKAINWNQEVDIQRVTYCSITITQLHLLLEGWCIYKGGLWFMLIFDLTEIQYWVSPVRLSMTASISLCIYVTNGGDKFKNHKQIKIFFF